MTIVKRLINKVDIPIYPTTGEDGAGEVVFNYKTKRTVQLFSCLDGGQISTGITKFQGGYLDNGEERYIWLYETDKDHNAAIDPATGERKIKHLTINDKQGYPTIREPQLFTLNLKRNQFKELRIPEDKVLIEDLLNCKLCANRRKTVDGEIIFPDKCLYFINDEASFAVAAEAENNMKITAWEHFNSKVSKDLHVLAATSIGLGLDVDENQLQGKHAAYKIELHTNLTSYINNGGYVEYMERVVNDEAAFSKECYMKLALRLHIIERNEDGVYKTNVTPGSKGISFGTTPEMFWQKLAEHPDVEAAISEKIHFTYKRISKTTIKDTAKEKAGA